MLGHILDFDDEKKNLCDSSVELVIQAHTCPSSPEGSELVKFQFITTDKAKARRGGRKVSVL